MRCYHSVSKNLRLTQGEAGNLEVTSVYNTKGKSFVGARWVLSGNGKGEISMWVLHLIFPFQMILSLFKSFGVLKEFLGFAGQSNDRSIAAAESCKSLRMPQLETTCSLGEIF